MKVVATLYQNYNGWDIEIDGHESEHWDNMNTLADISAQYSDEDGYTVLPPDGERKIGEALIEMYGPKIELILIVDQYSS